MYEQIKKDMVAAMKDGDKFKLNVISNFAHTILYIKIIFKIS